MLDPPLREIYVKRFIGGPRFDQIEDPLLQEAVIDAGVNHGQPMVAS